MLVSCHGRRPWAAVRELPRLPATAPLLAVTAPALSGCAEVAAGPAAWWALLALAAGAASAAYLLGAARSRMNAERALREARSQAALQAELHDGTPWLTDAEHRLRSWEGRSESPAAAALFADPSVRAALQMRRAFKGLRVELAQPLDHSRGWLLRGVPCTDDLGAFCGFAGLAQPLQAQDAQQATAAALAPLLALHPGPALVALDTGQGWALHACNAAARSAWPELAPGQALPAALGKLPAAVLQAFNAAAPAKASAAASPSTTSPEVAEGWQVQPCEGLPAGHRALVLASAPAATADDSGQAPDSETASFSFTVSHDLRAPIRVVEGFTRIVKEDYGRLLDRVGNDHLDRVLGAAARMNLMIDALLTLARLSSQPLARQPVNLSQLAAYAIDDLRRTAPERLVDVEIEPELTAHGDPTLLRLVLENLLGNAWKYTGRTAKPRITLGTTPHGTGTAYVVRDNGAGFDMRSSERLFNLFQRMHSASEFPGHGVGLASVRRIVRRHGGDIWAEAEPGRGAAFYFTLAG
jgi:signal transduction histidine kinase